MKTDKAFFILDGGFGSSGNNTVIKQCIWVCHSSMTAVLKVFATDENNLLVVQFLCYFENVITNKCYVLISNGNSDRRT